MLDENRKIKANHVSCNTCGEEFAREQDCKQHVKENPTHDQGFEVGPLELTWVQLYKISGLAAAIEEELRLQSNSPMAAMLVLDICKQQISLKNSMVVGVNFSDVIKSIVTSPTSPVGQA